MRWIRYTLLLLVLTFAAPRIAHACPACSDAIESGKSTADDADNFPAAMNQSIYLMIGVPYAAFFIVGYMIYRGVKKNEAFLAGELTPSTASPAAP